MDDDQAVYVTNSGPLDGPLRDRDYCGCMGVSTDPDRPWQPEGIAYGTTYLPHWRGPIAVFRLEVRKEAIPGRWVLVSRRFVPVEEWEEREAIRELG